MNEIDVSKYFEKNVSRRKLLLGLTSLAILPFGQEAKAFSGFDPFSFGYVTGSYLTTGQTDNYKLLQESQLFLQDAIKGLNAEQLDFVLFGGDNVEAPGNEEANWQLFLDIAQGLSCPWNFVLGEQDISGALMSDPMKVYGRDWKGKGIDRDVPYWSYDPVPGVHAVGLFTARRNSSVGNLGKPQLDWLKEDLKANRRKFTIVMSHHPLLPPAPFDGGSPWDDYVVPQGASAREIMGQFPSVRLALSGHVHINKIQQERSIWYVSSPSLAVYPCAYRIFRVTPDYITVETYQIAFPALIKKAKQKVETWSLPYKYSAKVDSFTELMDGGKANQFARLPLAAGKAMEPMSPKKRKEGEKSSKTHKGEKSEKAGTTSDNSAENAAKGNQTEEHTDERKGLFGRGKKKKDKGETTERSDTPVKSEKTDKAESREKTEPETKKNDDAGSKIKVDNDLKKLKEKLMTPDAPKPAADDAKPAADDAKSAPETSTPAPETAKSAPDETTSDKSTPDKANQSIPELFSAPDPKAKQQDKKHK